MKTPAEYISMDPDDAEVATGLLNDVDVTVLKAEYVRWTYPGLQTTIPALNLKMESSDGETCDDYISCGSLDRMEPSEDGQFLVPTEGSHAKGLSNSSNGYAFFSSLKSAGYPMEKLREGISILDGTRWHILRVPQQKRGGLVTPEKTVGGKSYPKTVLTVSEILSYPWDDGKVKGRLPAQKPANGQRPLPTETLDARTEAHDILTGMLGIPKYKQGIASDDLYQLFFAEVKGHPRMKTLLSAIQEDDFVSSGPFQVVNDVILPK